MKQRLVGILVVGCLAVIVISLLLDGAGIQPPPLSTTIPSEPEFPTREFPEPTRPAIVADTLPTPGADSPLDDSDAAELASLDDQPALPAFEPEPEPEEAAPKPASPPATAEAEDALEAAVAAIMAQSDRQTDARPADATPRLDSSGLPAAFVVRLGSFAEKANADALVARLLQADYKAYSRTVTTANGVFNAVYVGPLLTRAEANDMVNKLSARFQLKGVVENFTMQPLP